MKKTIYTLLVATLALTATSSRAQLVTTVAGGPVAGYSGDGGAATAAEISNPIGVVADGAGNVYFADFSNGVVRKIDAAGIITTFAGKAFGAYPGDGGPATDASLAATGLAVDASGNVYIADNGNHRICKVNSLGIITTIAGTGAAGSSGDGGPATAAKLNAPYDVDVDGAGNIYIADRGNHEIRKIDGSGNITTIAGTGVSGYTGDGGNATAAKISGPLGVGVDAAGNVYVADYNNHVVRKIDLSGTMTTFAGTGTVGSSGDGGPATAAQLSGVCNVKVDGVGNVYMAEDATGNMVRVVNNSGLIDRYAGFPGMSGFSGEGGPANSAKFYNTRGVAIDPAGNVFISDAGNNRVRRVGTTNHAPSFTGGATQSIGVCGNTAGPINSLLTVDDTDATQVKTWSAVNSPAHGSLVITYSTSVSGSTLTPTGLSYSPVAGYSGADAFSVRVTDGLSSDTISVAVSVNAAPAPVLSVSGITLSTTATFAGYQWLSGSTPIAGETNATYTPSADGSYAVTVTDAGGCAGTSALQAVSVTSVHDVAAGNIFLYPNPVVNGQFSLNVPATTNMPVRIVITNVLGKQVKELTATANSPVTVSMDVPGVYFLSAITEAGKYTAKLIVQ